MPISHVGQSTIYTRDHNLILKDILHGDTVPQRILFWSISSHMIITPSLNFIHGIFLSRIGTRGSFYFEEDVETVCTPFPWMDG
jgi:hypothetical protein